MYESPIKLITSQITSELVQGVDGEIFKAVQKVGVMVDRDELLRALAYDGEQYQKGYADRDAEIVRCHNCKWHDNYSEKVIREGKPHGWCDKHNEYTRGSYFCADGERREQE